jgi:hypothetical protein
MHSAKPEEDGGAAERRGRWYGSEDEGAVGGHRSRLSRRAHIVFAGALGLMSVVFLLVISPLDLKLASRKPGMTREAERFDKGAGSFVRSETDTLLSKGTTGVHLQGLIDMSDVTAAAKSEIKALKSLRSGWGFAGSKLSAVDGSDGAGPSGAIIASATDVYEQASKLAGDSAAKGARESQLQADTADAVSLAATSTTSTAVPFAKDKGWSLAREKSDMDAFYDSLDHKAAVKEAAARKRREAKAAFRATVAKAKAELKEIDEETEAKQHAEPRAAAQQAEAKAAEKVQVASQEHVAQPIKVQSQEHAAKPIKLQPKLSAEASREKMQGYFDGLVKASKHEDLAHAAAEHHPTLTADAARNTIDAYFSSLEPKKMSQMHTKHVAKEKQAKLTDAQARKGALSFFDAEVTKERAQMHLVAKKLGVRKAADTVEKLQADHGVQKPVGAHGGPAGIGPKSKMGSKPAGALLVAKVRPLDKASAHALAASALKQHDAVVAAQQKKAEKNLLKTDDSKTPGKTWADAHVSKGAQGTKPAAVPAKPAGKAGDKHKQVVSKGGKPAVMPVTTTGKVSDAHKQVATVASGKSAEMARLRKLGKVKVQLEQWPYVP